MNGVVIESHVSIVEASGADAVIVGSVAVETAQLGRPFTIRNGETEFQRALANRDEHEHTRGEGREKPVVPSFASSTVRRHGSQRAFRACLRSSRWAR